MTSGYRLRIDVLGPIRVRDAEGHDLTPEGVLQRRLLALLVLRRGRAVGVDAAIDALWPVDPPRDPVAALQNQVFRLRRRLPDGVVESTGDGYRMAASAIELDVDRVAGALSGAPGPELLAALDAVIERWHGPAYPELDDVDEGRTEATRLAELRLRALEVRAECRLTAGETASVIPELTALVDAEPLRERPVTLLMTALARGDRRVEALRAYDDFRRRLGDELGIEPSPTLSAQHAELLTGSGLGPWTVASRLPVPATSLVGRDALAEEVTAATGPNRVVTLVGPGGVGKTRLAVEVGHRLRAERADRPVVLCELAPSGPDAAMEAVAAALRVDARPGVGPPERVAAVLGDSELVLVLDNCEHVLDPIAELVERLVGLCPNVTVLATSRERLRVPGERVLAVPTLPWDGADGAAVRLFVERAQAVAPGFAPDEADLAAVADIVRRLDGLPLAIELAASRLHTHDLAEVAAGLDERFSLLSSGYRTSARHGSLRAAVSWSHGLLDEGLRRTFADLSVFAGSFTVEDAAAVCDDDPVAVAAALAQLTERSLVMRAPGRRYVLLESLRAFGAEQLAAGGRAEATRDRHAHHQVDWVEEADRRLVGPEPGVAAEIDAAIPDLRAALTWLLEHDRADLAGRLVVALLDYGLLGQRPDVLAWAVRVAEAHAGEPSLLAARTWAVAAYAAWMSGDGPEVGVRSERALRVAEAAGGPIPSEVATFRGNTALFEGRLDEAVRWYRRAAEAAADDPAQRLITESTEVLALAYAGDPEAGDVADRVLDLAGDAITPHAAYAWFCAGESVLERDVALARERFEEALRRAELAGAPFVIGLAGASKASIDARLGDPGAAAEAYRRLIPHWRRAGVWSTQWTMLRSIAVLLERLGRPYDAAVLEGAVRSTTAGHRIFGTDESVLAELAVRLRAGLGDEAYERARREGARLDGDAAVEHALRML